MSVFTFKSNLLKLGYGYDISGEVQEGGGTSGKGKDIEETQEPWTQHNTGPNPVNINRDSDAEAEFPEIVNKSNIFPTRKN
jgi:hypothetical protein